VNGVRGLLLAGALLFGGTFAQAREGNFVGYLEGTDAFVAIVSDGEEVLAFVCDGEALVVWLRGAVENGSLVLNSPASAAQRYLLETQLGASAEGSLFLNGERLPFTAEAAIGEAGLYRAEETLDGVDYVGGWIVDQNGEQRGSVVGGTSSRSASLDLETLQADVEDVGTLTARHVTPDSVAP